MFGIERSAWLLAILSAVLQVLIFPLPNFYLMSWIAVAPLMVALLRTRLPETLQLQSDRKLLPARSLQGFLLGYACGILWYGGNCYWIFSTMKQYGGVGTLGAAGLLILFSLYFALYHAAFGLIITLLAKRSLRTALVFSPFVWVAVELARTRISGFPWDLLGITQVDNIALPKIATFTGVYGISLEIMIVNSAFAAALVVRRSQRKPLLLASLMAAALLQLGRLVPAPPLITDHTALLVQENIPVLDSTDWTRQFFDDTLADLTRISLKPPSGEPLNVDKHPDLVVWPESPAPFYTGDPLFRMGISHLATNAHAWIVAGGIGVQNANMSAQQTTQIFNSASLINPNGDWDGRYNKVHLVPFGEYLPFAKWLSFAGGLTKEVGDFSRGTSRAPLQAGNQKLGIFICYESIFPDEIRRVARDGAQVFVN